MESQQYPYAAAWEPQLFEGVGETLLKVAAGALGVLMMGSGLYLIVAEAGTAERIAGAAVRVVRP